MAGAFAVTRTGWSFRLKFLPFKRSSGLNKVRSTAVPDSDSWKLPMESDSSVRRKAVRTSIVPFAAFTVIPSAVV